MAEQRIMQMQSTIDAMNRTVQDLATEVVQLRTVAGHAHGQVQVLSQRSTDAWESQAKRLDDVEQELQDVQAQVRRGGGGQGERLWNLDHKVR